MRNPNRIEPFLEKVAKVWHKWPDQRFGQLMVNFFGDCKRDPFFPEEDAWEVALDAYLEGRDPSVALDRYYREMYRRLRDEQA